MTRITNRRQTQLKLESLESRTVPALVATMVADIDPSTALISDARVLWDFGGWTYLQANDGIHGNELWKSDGTAAGTTLVKDINPGPADSSFGGIRGILNGIAYFTARDADHGLELWRTDGSTDGTYMVIDINPGPADSRPEGSAVLNGIIYFRARDVEHSSELWRTDGTAAGTWLVADINPGVGSSEMRTPVELNSVLYFAASSEFPHELWRTDGTSAGTWRVKVIGSGLPAALKLLNGGLVFQAGESNEQLWRSDGTPNGTVGIATVQGASIGGLAITTSSNGVQNAYFSAGPVFAKRLWKSDGTAAGTVQPNPNMVWSDTIEGPVALNDRVYFSARTSTEGDELWTSDGTVAGTVMLTNASGVNPSQFVPQELRIGLGRVIFNHYGSAAVGRELWCTNGTRSGTTLIQDIYTGVGSSSPTSFRDVNGVVFFFASDPDHGRALWRLDEVQIPAQVSNTRVNNGAEQRSRVTELSIAFNAQVNFAGSVADAFTLTRNSGGPVNFTATASVVNGVTVVTLNNFTGPETQFGSLRDGNFTLTALASQISANGQPMAANYTFNFFRFYGDLNGDRRVDITDFGFFSLAYLNPLNYNAALDFNNDGRIDIADFGQFSVRFFTTLP